MSRSESAIERPSNTCRWKKTASPHRSTHLACADRTLIPLCDWRIPFWLNWWKTGSREPIHNPTGSSRCSTHRLGSFLQAWQIRLHQRLQIHPCRIGADIDRAAQAILHCATVNSGQACFSIERVYVHESIASEFNHLITSLAESISLNTKQPDKGAIGPIISTKQIEVIDQHLQDAKNKNANILTGGIIEQHGGSWLRPTIVTNVDHSMLLMRKETFAPIVPIMTFNEISEAVHYANDSEYGLSAAVFGDLDESETVALDLEAGGVYCNDVDLIGSAHESAEKMSFKNSGLGGSRYGPEGITRFTRKQSVVFQHGNAVTIDQL